MAPLDDEGMAGERRIVTVLFADLVDSTAVAERLDPEDWAALAERALVLMSDAVGAFGGSVARLMGDGLLALFGAPVASEDDAERAVLAGLRMTETSGHVREEAVRLGVDLRPGQLGIRVGIATGEVVAGEVGSASLSEYTVLGDAANLAARLEKLADPDSVLIAPSTQALVAHAIETRIHAPVEVRGKQEPVQPHVALRLADERSTPRGLSTTVPSIGRADELGVLSEAVEAMEHGRGGIVLVFGDAGIGKSRLVADALAGAAEHDPPPAVFRTAPLSFESGAAYSVAGRVLAVIEEKAAAAVAAHLATLSEARRHHLEETLDAVRGGSGRGTDALTVEAVASAFIELIGAVVGGRGAVIVVVDDVHWADEASADLLIAVLGLTDRVPVLAVLAARPERQGPAWRIKQVADREFPHRLREVHLRPLDDDDARSLVQTLLADLDLDPAHVAQLVGRAGGNPFFLEEIVRELVQAGVLVPLDGRWALAGGSDLTGRVPATLQRLFQARFDRLRPEARSTLEVAAVIGRTFGEGLLERAVGRAVGADVVELLRVGLVEEQPGHPRTFAFRHALAQEAAYESILHRRRRVLHRKVGEAIEADDPPGMPTAAVLARHFHAAGEGAKSAVYALEAGERAVELGAYLDACGLFELGLSAEGAPEEVRVALHLGRGRSRDVVGALDGALDDLEAALSGARDLGNRHLEWRALVALGELWAARDYERTGDYFRSGLDVARTSENPEMLGTSLNRLGNWYANASDPRQGIAMHTEALSIFETSGAPAGVAASHDLLAMASLIAGESRGRTAHYEKALAIFRRLGDRRGTAAALIGSAMSAPNYEEPALLPAIAAVDALAMLDEALGIVRDIGWASGEAYTRFVTAHLLGCVGRLGEALAEGERALRLAETIGHDQWRLAALLVIGSVEADAFRSEGAVAHFDGGRRLAEETHSMNWILNAVAMGALPLIRLGRVDDAVGQLEEVMGRPGAERFGAYHACALARSMAAATLGDIEAARRWLASVPRDHDTPPLVALAMGLTLSRDDPAAAERVLVEGAEAARRWDMRPAHARLEELLGRLPIPAAGEHLATARTIIRRCAESLADPQQRDQMVAAAEERLRAREVGWHGTL